MEIKDYTFKSIIFFSVILFQVSSGNSFANTTQQAKKTDKNKSGEIVVDISGCRNSKGNLVVCLYNTKDISEAKLAWKKIIVEPGDNKKVSFKNIPFGEYAIFVLHDEGKDGEFTMRWLPWPKPLDGAGYSNGAKPNFGPAEYDDAKFIHSKLVSTQKIKMIYG